MRANHYRTIVLASLAFAGLAAGATAQERQNLLTSIEVQYLVSRAEPTDHTRLRNHFVALADEYTAQAKRNTNLARAPWGNPNRRSGASAADKFARLANQATESAATVRALAVHHERLAAGLPSAPPAGSARFDAGAGAPAPSEAQLRELAAGARTAADHRSLEEYFTTLAAKYSRAAASHAAMAAGYRGNPRGTLTWAAMHHERQAREARDAAADARAAAAEHRQLTQVG